MIFCRTAVVFLIAAAAGTGIHFLYSGLSSVFTSLLAPVNESIWEHLKLLYWPALIGGLVLERRDPNWGARCMGILVGAAIMQGVGWLYHIRMGGDALWVDILLYLAVMLIAFLLPVVWRAPERWTPWLTTAVILLGVAIIRFTFVPLEDFAIFQEKD